MEEVNNRDEANPPSSNRPRRITKSRATILPSASHPDVSPPSLVHLQRVLRAHTKSNTRGEPCAPVPLEIQNMPGMFALEGAGGGHYKGDLLGGLPHGYGQHWIPFLASSGGKMHMVYEGQWRYGNKTGVGSIFYSNGQEYRGDVKDGKRCGRGCMRYNDGSIYVGDWLRGRRHGLGTLYYKNGNWYKGAFCKDSKDGWGTFFWPTMKRKLEGEWVANCPYSGFYSVMVAEDYQHSDDIMLKKCPYLTERLILQDIPEDEKQILELKLKHPFLTIYDVISLGRFAATCDRNNHDIYKTQVGRKESLSSIQLYALKKSFDAIASCSFQKVQLPIVHLRRLLILSQIDPDEEQGQKLLIRMEEIANGRDNITFDDFLFCILQFHYPCL